MGEIRNDQGVVIANIPDAQLVAFQRQLQGNGGGGLGATLQVLAPALELGAGIFQASELQSAVDDARDARLRLRDAEDARNAYLRGSGTPPSPPSVIDPLKLADLWDDLDDAQRDLDAAQNRGMRTLHQAMIVELVGNGAQLFGAMTSGNGMALGDDATAAELLAAGGISALLVGLFADSSGGGRGRGRGRRRDR